MHAANRHRFPRMRWLVVALIVALPRTVTAQPEAPVPTPPPESPTPPSPREGTAPDQLLDPYAGSTTKTEDGDRRTGEPVPGGLGWLPPDFEPEETDKPEPGRRSGAAAKPVLLGFGALYGATMGLALTGPEDRFGEIPRSSYLTATLGAGMGMAVAYWSLRNHPQSSSQAMTIAWGGLWGGLTTVLIADVWTGVDDTGINEVVKSAALGGILGMGLGIWYTGNHDPSMGDIALVNSLGLYGVGAGIALADVLEPPTSEAYAINAGVGAVTGLALGAWLSRRWQPSATQVRLVDLGVVAGGLLPWLVAYPALVDTESGRRISSGLSVLGMVGGGYLAWRLTRGLGRGEASEDADDEASTSAVPGLWQRTQAGIWRVGAPSIRPLIGRAGDPAGGRGIRGAIVDLAGGHF